MVLLFISEFKAFIKIKTSSEMLVDTSHSQELLNINMDIIVTKLPCSIITLNVQDVMGTNSLNVHGKLVKNRVDQYGKFISIYKEPEYQINSLEASSDVPQPDYELLKKEVINKEGCQLVGNINVLRVPGNFHISSGSYVTSIGRLIGENLIKYDLSHKINHISFGDESDIQHIKSNFNIGNLNPLDGVIREKKGEADKYYEYYLKVVPTSYINISNKAYDVNQFTSNSNEVQVTSTIPSIYFRYDIAPILVRFQQYKENFFEFFVQICAIVGGIYSVIGILDTLINKLLRSNNS
jgi:hypothetical protein